MESHVPRHADADAAHDVAAAHNQGKRIDDPAVRRVDGVSVTVPAIENRSITLRPFLPEIRPSGSSPNPMRGVMFGAVGTHLS
ncbi:hypothetical protein [Nocardia abscessus]|uniref:hypothetical protein n=1 Tax=Nocardia abscessus TaxID=120957 RepID=UPI0012FCBC26|nr:hypothetical protein [Nocardia abscessus]MCC3330025.1 hypothetical protein [Nocardia abscessus]